VVDRWRILVVLAVALIVGGALFASGRVYEGGTDAEARADAAAAKAESAAAKAAAVVQARQTIDTFISLRQACSRGNLRARQSNAVFLELRAFVLDAAAARQATGDPAVADRYRMRAERIGNQLLPLVDCAEAYPRPNGVTAAQVRTRLRAATGTTASTVRAPSVGGGSTRIPGTPTTPAPQAAPRGTPTPRRPAPAAPSTPATPTPATPSPAAPAAPSPPPTASTPVTPPSTPPPPVVEAVVDAVVTPVVDQVVAPAVDTVTNVVGGLLRRP
jgi:hypothetical protein